ncbi:MAG TPA: ThuA domain-containing protein [Allosphingosinicella sp.]
MTFLRQLLLLIGLAGLFASGAAAAPASQPRVLLYSGSTGYRHASIEPGVAAIKALGAREKIVIVHSEDPSVFTDANLRGFQAIIFLSTSTDPKKPESEWFQGARRDALQAFVHRGGGIVGIHAASDSHYNWPWYGKMIGGHFARHPQGTPEGVIKIVDRKHAATKGLPATVRRVDEWYYFDDYDPEAHLLVSLDPATIGEKDANPNPVSWAKEFEGGRVFYTAMGHTNETYTERNFLNHLAGGLRWVMKRR